MILDREGMRTLVKEYCDDRSQSILAIDSGSHNSSVNKAVHDNMPVCRKIAAFFGYEKVVMYRKITK